MNPNRNANLTNRNGRPKGAPNKTTSLVRNTIAKFADANVHKMQEWLDQIAADPKYGPKAAFDCYLAALEYAIPKLARVEESGDKTVTHVVRWPGMFSAQEVDFKEVPKEIEIEKSE